MRKPFSIEELIVRINNLLQLMTGRPSLPGPQNEDIGIGKYLFKPGRYELHSPSRMIKLSQRDMEILQLLVAHRNRITDRKDLLMAVWVMIRSSTPEISMCTSGS